MAKPECLTAGVCSLSGAFCRLVMIWICDLCRTHFNIALDSIDVNGDAVKLPTSIFDFVKKQAAIVDSGTTLAYFPDEVYNQLMEKVC